MKRILETLAQSLVTVFRKYVIVKLFLNDEIIVCLNNKCYEKQKEKKT